MSSGSDDEDLDLSKESVLEYRAEGAQTSRDWRIP